MFLQVSPSAPRNGRPSSVTMVVEMVLSMEKIKSSYSNSESVVLVCDMVVYEALDGSSEDRQYR